MRIKNCHQTLLALPHIRRVLLLIGLHCISMGFLSAQKPPLGTWRDHLPHSQPKHIAIGGSRIYAGGDYSLFYYDREDQSVNRMTKVQGFSDIGISKIAYYEQKDALVIAYRSANIDLLINNVIYSIPDFKNSTITGSKEVLDIRFDRNNAYLSTHFGVIVLDLDRKEVKDVYVLGDNSSFLKVNTVAFNDTSIFAATEFGLFYADKNDPFLANYQRWKRWNDPSVLDTLTEVKDVKCFSDKIIIASISHKDTLTYRYSTNFQDWTAFASQTAFKSQCLGNRFYLFNYFSVQVFDEQLNRVDSIETILPCYIRMYDGEIDKDHTFWMAHEWDGLAFREDYTRYKTCYHKIQAPNSPQFENFYQLAQSNGNVFLLPGGRTTTFGYREIVGDLATFATNRWTVGIERSPKRDTLQDFVKMVTDPRDPNHHFIASWTNGIVELHNDTIKTVYNDANTAGVLEAQPSEKRMVVRTGSVAFDKDYQLWCINSLRDNALVVRTEEGRWKGLYTRDQVSNGSDLVDLLVCSSTNDKWFFNRGNRIFVHDGGNRLLWINPNEGNDLFSTMVNCITEDRNGVMWIGTDRGVKAIYHVNVMSESNLSRGQSNVKVYTLLATEDGDTRYLLENTTVTSIAVDAANRKWVGTKNAGVFLFSENLDQQILKFNEQNSPLFSNNIIQIEINQMTGEVFFLTEMGLLSYMSETREASDNFSNVMVYPNPIEPGYEGPIAIKGLMENSFIHITDIVGNTVFTTRSLGGQAVWNGKTLSGQRVASGVYLVFMADQLAEERAVAKILFLK